MNGVIHRVRGVCPYDCPDSCAWTVDVQPSPTGPRAVRLRGAADHPLTRGGLCPKVTGFLERTAAPDRLLHPLVRTGPKGSGSFRRASWEEALELVADRLRERTERHGGATVLPFGFAGTEGIVQRASMSERFFAALGASDRTGSVCGAVSAAGTAAVQGAAHGFAVEDLVHSRLVLLWGTDTLVTNRHVWPLLQQARAAGAWLVCVDPLRTATARACDEHVHLLPGTDVALVLGLVHVLHRDGLVDRDWAARHVLGLEDLLTEAATWTPERTGQVCGVPPEQVEALAGRWGTTRPAAVRPLIGLERHGRSGDAYRAVACLPAVTGAWRDVGGGLCRSTGSLFDLMFDRSVLSRPDLAPGPRRALEMGRLGEHLTSPDLGPPVTALVVYNANPAVTVPDQRRVLAGLAREDLLTVVLEHRLTDTARHADVVLPATMQVEHLDLMVPWGHQYLILNEPAVPPRGETLPNTEIFRRLARAVGLDHPLLREDDESMVRSFLTGRPGPWHVDVTLERLRAEGWVRVGPPPGWRPWADGGFPTPSGRLEVRPVPRWTPDREGHHGDPVLRDRYPLVLLTTRRRRALNSSHADVLASRDDHPWVEISIADAAARHVADGDRVRVHNDRGELRLTARLSDRVRPGVVSIPFGHGLDAAGAGVNALCSAATTDLGRGTAFDDTLVQITRDGKGDDRFPARRDSLRSD